MGIYYKELECGCVIAESTLEWPHQKWVSSPCNVHKEKDKKREEHDKSSTNKKNNHLNIL